MIMAISPEMQGRVEKIEKLIEEGYTLKKTSLGFIDFRNSVGKRVGVVGYNSPAGLSWIGLFFAPAVCTQMKEWSYFYVNGCVLVIASIFSGVIGFDLDGAAGTAVSISYGFMIPYLRKLNKDNGTIDMPKGTAIVVGILLAIVSSVPASIIDIAFAFLAA